MSTIRMKRGDTVAKQKSKVLEWYLILKGSVIQRVGFAQVLLGENAIVGILESDWFVCDYIAREDVEMEVIPVSNADDLKKLLTEYPEYRSIFVHASMEQRQQILNLYGNLQMKVKQFYAFVQTLSSHYQALCERYQLDPLTLSHMEYFTVLEQHHRTSQWELDQSISIIKNHLHEYLTLMEQDVSMSVGAIMMSSIQMHNCMLGVTEIVVYLNENRDLLLAESENDFFHMFFDLMVRAGRRRYDLEPLKKEMFYLIGFLRKIKIYPNSLMENRIKEYEDYDFGDASGEFASDREIDITKEDCLGHILDFAEYREEEAKQVRELIAAYRGLPDMLSTDNEAYKLRKQLTPMFFGVYERVFLNAMQNEQAVTPIVEMFLNFGFMDLGMVGEEHAKELYELTGRLRRFSSEHIYTIYEWIKSIYNGKNEPSKNEFDLDYPSYLLEQKKNGELTQEQVKALQNNQAEKAKFEIRNMFTSADRITYGKITTFCPILGEYDLINSLDKMSVTVERLENELNNLRMVDYSLFYRELNFIGPTKDIMQHELMNQEILPDIILMPNAGTKSMMWQETAGKTRDTSARFLFPIFTTADLGDLMVETAGRYRWEMCRKIMGVRWNDIREKSLTAEYCDYIQFYRKNHDLSVDAKDKLKNALARAKNSYREVFVKDYQNWVKFESKGSFRLNKVARDILVRYCPFAKDIRTDLKANPVYQNTMPRMEMENAKKVQRLTALYDKYEKAGGEITAQMEENLQFYQL